MKKGSAFWLRKLTNPETSHLPDDKKSSEERLKKPVIFILMGIVFLGCMYLIFKTVFRQGGNRKYRAERCHPAGQRSRDAG